MTNIEHKEKVHELVREALAEDKREGSKFDADGFSNFFPEEAPELVQEAWRLYDQVTNGGLEFR